MIGCLRLWKGGDFIRTYRSDFLFNTGHAILHQSAQTICARLTMIGMVTIARIVEIITVSTE